MTAVAASRHIAHRLLHNEQLVFQLVVAEFEGAGLGAGTVGAIAAVAVALQVVPVEEVGLVAEGAGNPLPAEVVAGGVTIQQML